MLSSKVWMYRIKEIIIRNFKSIKELKIPLQPGVNVLVGPNGSGKTNILEAISFLYKSLVAEAGKIPYTPHLPRYWSPLDIFYMKDPRRNIELGFVFEFYRRKTRRTAYFFKTTITVRYGLIRDTVAPIEYIIDYNNGETVIKINNEYISAYLLERLYSKHKDKLEVRYRKEKGSIYSHRVILGLPPTVPLLPYKINLLVGSITRYLKDDKEIFSIEYNIPSERRLSKFQYLIEPKSVRITEELSRCLVEAPYIRIVGMMLPPELNALFKFLSVVLKDIIFLRHPDIGALREPKPLASDIRLSERAINLAPVLLNLIGRYGGIPERIQRAFMELFPGLSFRVESQLGRAVLVASEDGLELTPSNIPDGAIKLLAILTAIELNPSILLIDEIENSMHARMLEYVIDQLNSLRQPVLVATHSPIVVDLAGPERVLIVKKDASEGTIIEKISDPKQLSKELRKAGITLSDYIFYKKTWTQ